MLLKIAYGIGLFLVILRFQTDTPPPPLEEHFPQPEQIATYLNAYVAQFLRQDSQDFHYTFSAQDQWVYWDINDDSELDLIFFSPYGNLFILLWQGDHYAEPYSNLHPHEFRAGAKMSFEDWTADGTVEVIFDFYNAPLHGTGVIEYEWHRTVIHCGAVACTDIWRWRYNALSVEDDYDGRAISLLESNIQRSQSATGVPQIEEWVYAFTLGCGSFDVKYPPLAETRAFIPTEIGGQSCATPEEKGLRVSPVYRNTYLWNGTIFEEVASVRLSEPYLIATKQQFNAENQQGDVASVFFQFNFVSQNCYLTINQHVTWNSPFECLEEFTSVDWVDVFGTGEPIVMVNTLVPELECILAHRLILYRTGGYTLFDNTTCISTPEVYPLHLGNMDSDKELEVIVPPDISLDCTQYIWHTDHGRICVFLEVVRQELIYYDVFGSP